MAASLHARAALHADQGEFAAAEPLAAEALAIQRRHYGEVHSQVATTLHNLAVLTAGRGRLDEALDSI